jgi:carboxyvinyl-carboxyphosphonate phosphorylmutase
LIDRPNSILVLPGAYDGLSATLVERAGFEAIYLTGSGVSYARLAQPDLSFVGLAEMTEHARLLAAAVSIPILADADTGYGNAMNVWHTVRALEQAGVAGIQLEDQVFPKRCGHYEGRELITVEEMVAKIRAAREARLDQELVVVARTDARTSLGLDEAIRRARRYQRAGADVLFVESLESATEMRAVTAALEAPTMANMVEGGRSPLLSAGELLELGYRLVIFPNAIARASSFAIQELLHVLRTTGSSRDYLDRMLDFSSLSELVHLPEWLAREREYR